MRILNHVHILQLTQEIQRRDLAFVRLVGTAYFKKHPSCISQSILKLVHIK